MTLVDTATVAAAFGVQPATIRQWVKRGHLAPSGRIGNRNAFTMEDLVRRLGYGRTA